ncbi:MAG: PQQ-binding-like beta-propeller repeat protein [Pirellulaceae bacterium]
MALRRWLNVLFGVGMMGWLAAEGVGADWPQWRGPQRNGVSQETGLLAAWPQEGPKLLWQIKGAGAGYSTPAVVGDQLYLINNRGVDDEFVQARSTRDGSLVWERRIGKVGKPDQRPAYPGARSTPTVAGDLVLALGSDGDLVCLDRATGQTNWHKNLHSEYGGVAGQWAYSESPLVDGSVVVCTPGGEQATLLAVDKETGSVVWKSAVPGGDAAGYASVIVVNTDGVKQYVQFLGKGIVGVDAKTGKFLWRYDRTGSGPANMPTPVASDSFVYSAGGRTGAALLELAAKGNSVEAVEKYYSNKLPTAIGGSVIVNGYLYGTNSGGLMCVELVSGDVKWQERCVGQGSVCYADGRLYVHGENGDVALVDANPAAYQEKGRFTPPQQPERKGQAWTYPVVANGRFYLHDTGTIWCYDVKASP